MDKVIKIDCSGIPTDQREECKKALEYNANDKILSFDPTNDYVVTPILQEEIVYTEDELLSQSRVVSKNETQAQYKARRALLRYAMNTYTKKTLGVVTASYLDHVKLFSEISNIKYINTTEMGSGFVEGANKILKGRVMRYDRSSKGLNPQRVVRL